MVASEQRTQAKTVHNALYSSDLAEQSRALSAHLDDDCLYTDPLMSLNAKQGIQSSFALVARYLSPSPTIHSITSDQNVVTIDCTIKYKLFFIPLMLRTLISFTFGGGKIVKIEEVWSLRDLYMHVPFLGPLYKQYLLPANGKIFAKLGSSLIAKSKTQ
eukprot:NODE_134_length_16603_cov_0.784052.p12 type:complete len:159 gc:universal NODE_134_length_16603_cov_0.784052:12183-11707(-)